MKEITFMKNWIKNNYKNYLCLLFSIVLLGVVSVLFNNSNFGSDSIFCLNQGIAEATKLSLGVVNILLNLLFIIIMLIINRKAIGVGTVLMLVLLGLSMNIMLKLNFIPDLKNVDVHPVLYVFLQCLYIISGLAIGGFAISLYFYANRGLAPFEGVLAKITEVTKIPFWAVKIVNDVIFYVVGFLLGGTIGIGSIIAATLYGPSISLFGKLWKKFDFLGEYKKNEKTN